MSIPRPLTGIMILIIEDDRDTAELFAAGLELLGATASHVQDGEQALSFLAAWRVDALVCDVALPGLDGHELLARIRALPGYAAVPAITVTAFAAPEDRERSIASGFLKHLVKPVVLGDVAAAIASVVPASTMTVRDLAQFRAIVTDIGVRSPCRYASVLRFDDSGFLLSIWTFDRERPTFDTFPLREPIASSYCSLVRAAGSAIEIENARTDARTQDHPKRDEIASYLGFPLVANGRTVGTVCCFDPEPREFSAGVHAAFEAAAELLSSLVGRSVHW